MRLSTRWKQIEQGFLHPSQVHDPLMLFIEREEFGGKQRPARIPLLPLLTATGRLRKRKGYALATIAPMWFGGRRGAYSLRKLKAAARKQENNASV